MSNQVLKSTRNVKTVNEHIECPRCLGKGWLPEFRHVKGGICFLCGGAKVITPRSKGNAKTMELYVIQGTVNMYHPVVKGAYVKKFRTALVVSFDGGRSRMSVPGLPVIEGKREKNDPELQRFRQFWRWVKDNGGQCYFQDQDKATEV